MDTDEPFSSGRILIVAAHPDDEVIGAGGQLPRLRDRVDIVHATNGSPDNNQDYASARRQEVLGAVGLAGISPDRCHQLPFVDQQSSFHLVELTESIRELTARLRPEVVLTHPYEGGHPDHDSCAFAVRAAVGRSAEIWEFTSYHIGPAGEMATGEFLQPGLSRDESTRNAQVRVLHLRLDQQTLKRQMFDCFQTQLHVLSNFCTGTEQFRLAPRYDFIQPPHPGQLYYEQFEWGVQGRRWRELAAEALQKLGMELHATHSS